jgi:predicted RNA binding protein YcfA (HicA-like mRNA interferase family)
MSRREKLYRKLKNSPNSGSFDDVDNLLRWCGFELRRVKGSHHIYKREGYAQIVTVPYHKPLKTTYVKKALELFERFYDFDET